MKKTLYGGMASALLLSGVGLVFAGGPRIKANLTPKKFVTQAEQMRKLAAIEDAAASKIISKKPVFPSAGSKTQGDKSINLVSYSYLGQSRNPFSILTSGRNCVSADPVMNSVAFFRRGGLDDPGGQSGNAGNKVFYDLNTKGGIDEQWQISKGPVFDDDNFLDDPTHVNQGGSNNFGSRYPQGALWNPAGNADTSSALAIGVPRVLDGSNGSWGGLGYGWQKLLAGSAKTQVLESSSDLLHFRTESMEVTQNGVFMTEPIEDLSSGGLVFTDKIAVYKFTYNTAQNALEKTTTLIPFSNEGGDYATAVSNTVIAFGPDGQTGYIVVTAANNEFDSIATYIPYVSKTTDGGANWSSLAPLKMNKKRGQVPNPGLDAFRNKMLANQVYFDEAGDIYIADYADAANYKLFYVDYLVNDIDMVVDKDNYAHVFMSVAVSGFRDTLNSLFPDGITYRPGFGSWNMHVAFNDLSGNFKGDIINENVGLNGCWGDCAGDDNFSDANRPQAARSQDGSVVAFVWNDTDSSAHPQLTSDNNSNPDLWVQRIRVGNPGQFFYGPKTLNMTKGSDFDGLAALANVAPRLLNRPGGGHTLASTVATFAEYDPAATTAIMPTQHLYVGNVNIPVAVDSFPVPDTGMTILNQSMVAVDFLETINVQGTAAVCTVSVVSEGSLPVTARGVCWSTSPGPNVTMDTKTVDGSGDGVFTASLSGLAENTIYYLRGYATNASGTSYGPEFSFTTTVTSTIKVGPRREVVAMPNPSNGKVQFKGLSGASTLIIRNMLGTEVVRQMVQPGVMVDLSKLNRSTYFYSIESKDGNFFGRIVLN